ncbi:hypothetical protein GPECTOR_146g6 [Gonium pectorale]|uniref:Uncharacterized protein n=1 Tax=Gonium pectorale TaxID=33097 RepID=A0A150FXU5_GONPE|nr:hypothetical protein GPECTOR_146g6 [Gonium pectorale]|eukprot:KXZ42441.1 hypothetical protein GPECTOR_146g6 [Gonium pectorale]
MHTSTFLQQVTSATTPEAPKIESPKVTTAFTPGGAKISVVQHVSETVMTIEDSSATPTSSSTIGPTPEDQHKKIAKRIDFNAVQYGRQDESQEEVQVKKDVPIEDRVYVDDRKKGYCIFFVQTMIQWYLLKSVYNNTMYHPKDFADMLAGHLSKCIQDLLLKQNLGSRFYVQFFLQSIQCRTCRRNLGWKFTNGEFVAFKCGIECGLLFITDIDRLCNHIIKSIGIDGMQYRFPPFLPLDSYEREVVESNDIAKATNMDSEDTKQ